jgi:hypothetical protein
LKCPRRRWNSTLVCGRVSDCLSAAWLLSVYTFASIRSTRALALPPLSLHTEPGVGLRLKQRGDLVDPAAHSKGWTLSVLGTLVLVRVDSPRSCDSTCFPRLDHNVGLQRPFLVVICGCLSRTKRSGGSCCSIPKVLADVLCLFALFLSPAFACHALLPLRRGCPNCPIWVPTS